MKVVFFFLLLFFLPLVVFFIIWKKITKENQVKKRLQQVWISREELPISAPVSLTKPKPATSQWLEVGILGAVLIFFGLLGVSYIFLLVIGIVVYFLMKTIRNVFHNRRMNALTQSLPATIDFIIRNLLAGSSFLKVIGQVANSNFAAATEFQPIYEDLLVGKSFVGTLNRAAKRVNHPDFSFCMAVLIIQQETGQYDVKSLQYLSSLLRDKLNLRRKISANSSEAKIVGYVVAFLPFVSALALYLFNSHYYDPVFESPYGIYAYLGALCSNIIGLIVMKRMTEIKI